MYPRTLLADEVKSAAEVSVFKWLQAGLDEPWEVFHSVGLLERDHATGARDGEIDFVLCHPDEGILCLEVKGGDIECRHGEWYRRLGGANERVKDPFEQVRGQKHTLRKMIAAVDHGRFDDLLVAHGVGFPDIPVHSLVLAPDAPPQIVIDRQAFMEPTEAVARVLSFHRGSRDKRRPPGVDGAAMLRELLAPTIRIEVPLAAAFRGEHDELVELTRDQSALLARMGRNARMAVYGCAGSGKTMLAVEHAQRMAKEGKAVLFVCFNKALAAHLHTSCAQDGITFSTFHRLCTRVASKAGVEIPEYPEGHTPKDFFSRTLPDALIEALDRIGPQWDALIVDEAQDLHDDWLASLGCGLRDEDHAPVWLFLDDNQRIYDTHLTVPPGFFAWELTTNCRTTQAIHQQLLLLYEGSVKPDVRGPAGRVPELLHAVDQGAAVAEILDRLLGRDDVPPGDIVVLSSHALEKSALARHLGDRVCSGPPPKGSAQVRFSSIRAFKGLEAPVVVLCELEDLDDRTRDQQLYVGLSRARNHAIIVAPET